MHHKNHVHSITWKPLKLYSGNFIQISINKRWRAECKNLCLLSFLSYFPWNFVHHKNCVRSVTWKPLKLYSRNFIQVSANMSQRAECKNNNSVNYTLWVISLGTLPITKTFICDYFIPGYDCAIANTLTEIFTRYELIVFMKWLEFQLEIVFNVSVWNCI